MFLGIQGEAIFRGKDAQSILALMARQGQASRSAYQGIQEGLKNKPLRDHLKSLGHGSLGVRYLESAISSIENLSKKKKVLFGGKDNWKRLIQGELSKEAWHRLRNRSLFARGDRSKKGNPLIRVEGDKLKVLIPSGKGQRGAWIESERLRLFRPFPPDAQTCYNMRLLHLKGRKFEVSISWGLPEISLGITPENGVLGIDTNPNLLALVETDKNGNPVKRYSLDLNRIMDASQNKREADIFLAAKTVVDWALASKKPIALEDLGFGTKKKRPKGKPRNRGFNRMRCGWAYRKLLTAIERRAAKEGAPVIKVNPSHTSILGLAKHGSWLNRHHAAALTVARRAQGFSKERQTFLIVEKQARAKGQAQTARKPTLASQMKGPARIPQRMTRTVRLSAYSASRLRSQYLRGAGSPRANRPVEASKTAGLHGPSPRSRPKTCQEGRTARRSVQSPAAGFPIGGMPSNNGLLTRHAKVRIL